APPVRIEFFEHRGAADVVIADELDLVRSGENHARRIEKEIRGQVDEPSARKDGASPHERAAIERPAPPARLPAANLQGLLPTQVARFFVAQKLRRVAFGLGRHHLSQTITSFSSSRPYVERTRLRTWVISCIISALLARPALMKKFAWRSLTRAPPTFEPLRPSSSIMRPAEAPGGFLKMQPALFWPSGWLARRFSLQIRIPSRICSYGVEGSSSFTASIISPGANEVCLYSKEICSFLRIANWRPAARQSLTSRT